MTSSLCARSLRLRPWILALLALILSAPVLHAGVRRYELISQTRREIKGERFDLLSTARAVALTVDMKTFRAVAQPELHLKSVPVAPDRSVDLDLEAYDIIAHDAILTATGARGAVPLPRLGIKLYRGSVAGEPGSSVYLAFSDHCVLGYIRTEGRQYDIATDYGVENRAGEVAAVAYPREDLPGQLVACGVDDHNIERLGGSTIEIDPKRERGSLMAGEILFSVRGALDGDYEFYKLFNDSVKAAEYLIATVGRVSEAYERDISCQLSIGYLNIWTTNTDPYNESTVMSIALDEARDYWAAPAQLGIDRAFHHIFSGKAWVNPIGIAYLNVLCRKNRGGAFSAITRNNPTRDQFVVAHETGHMFGSKHTHSCSWSPAIDSCAAAEEGTCFGAGDIRQAQGTIMSYCRQADLAFGPKVSAWLKARLLDASQDISCIDLSRRLAVSVQQILFSEATLGQPKDTLIPVFFQNTGREPVHITGLELEGVNMDEFEILSPSLTGGGTLPIELTSGQTHELKIHYKATSEDASLGILKIEHDGLNPTINVTVEAYSIDDRPDFGFKGPRFDAIDFGQRKVGDKVDTAFGELYTNLGRTLLHITKAEIVGPDRFDFELLSGTAPIDIENLETYPAAIRFAPSTDGSKRAYLRVESNSRDKKVDTLTLLGTVRKGPLLIVKSHGLIVDFGQCEKGKQYDTMFSDFFANAGSDDLVLQVSTTEGRDARLFSTTLSGVTELAPGEASELGISFQSSANATDGWKQAYVAVYNEAQDAWDTIHVIAHVGQASAVPGEEESEASFTIVPNPTGGEARIDVMPLADEIGHDYTLRIVDAAGREVRRESGRFAGDGIHHVVERKSLPAGLYHVSVTTPARSRVRSLTITP